MNPLVATRTRWAAIGAALAVTLGAGGLGIARATAPTGASTYVPITPCRLADTRPGATQVGPHATPLGPDSAYTYDTWGDIAGTCNLPTGTTGLQLNITATDATTLTNLRLYPTRQPTPTASNLNPAPGQPPTPNAVTVTLNPTGQFDVYNRFGTVHIVIDVAGYYTDHTHDDRYYTKPQVDAAVAAAIEAARPPAPIAFDETLAVGETDELLRVSGVSITASCDSPTAASLYVDAVGPTTSFWLYGANAGTVEFSVRVASVDHWERAGNADYLFFNGVLYAGGDYYQLAIYSGHSGDPCVFWGLATQGQLQTQSL